MMSGSLEYLEMGIPSQYGNEYMHLVVRDFTVIRCGFEDDAIMVR